jgi:hypothetical protein
VSVSRTVLPVTSDIDRVHFGEKGGADQVGVHGGIRFRSGRTYAGAPDVIAGELSRDEAVREADTVMLTIPNQLGVDYNTRILQTIASHIAPAIGWMAPAASLAAEGA